MPRQLCSCFGSSESTWINPDYFSRPTLIEQRLKELNKKAGIPITDDLGRCLGTQLVHRRHGKAMYSQLMERYKRRMDGWKEWLVGKQVSITGGESNLGYFGHLQLASVLDAINAITWDCVRRVWIAWCANASGA